MVVSVTSEKPCVQKPSEAHGGHKSDFETVSTPRTTLLCKSEVKFVYK